jgi:thymidylate kinase
MIYIYEGVDLAGKSTLAERQSKEQNIPIIKKKLEVFKHHKKGWLKGPEVELITQMFFESIFPLGVKYDFILDRSLLSSLVYSKFFHREVKLDYIYEYLKGEKSNSIVINFVYCSEEKLYERYTDREEILFKFEELVTIQKIYHHVVNILISSGVSNIIKVPNE